MVGLHRSKRRTEGKERERGKNNSRQQLSGAGDAEGEKRERQMEKIRTMVGAHPTLTGTGLPGCASGGMAQCQARRGPIPVPRSPLASGSVGYRWIGLGRQGTPIIIHAREACFLAAFFSSADSPAFFFVFFCYYSSTYLLDDGRRRS